MVNDIVEDGLFLTTTPGLGGRLKESDADFVVREISPTGEVADLTFHESTLSFVGNTVLVHLPVSTMDIGGKGSIRTHECCCPALSIARH